MAEDKLMSSNWFKLVMPIILIFNQINNSSGSNSYTLPLPANSRNNPSDFPTSHGPACQTLISSRSTNYECRYYGYPVNNCDNARAGTTVLISCNSGYEELSLQESRYRVCRNGKWNPSVPECHPIRSETFSSGNYNPQFGNGVSYENDCPPLSSSETTIFKCKYNGELLKDCQNPRDGATVLISCNAGYEEPSLQENPIRVCRNGKWNPSIPKCYPIPGQTFSQASGNFSPQSGYDINQSVCPSLTSSETTNFKCKYNGVALKNCQNPRDGTTVLITCSSSYQEPSLHENPIRVCRNKQWNSEIPQCYSIPGTAPPEAFGNFNPPSNNQNTYLISSETPTNTFGDVNPSSGDGVNYSGTCSSLTSSIYRNVECHYNDNPLRDCVNPVHGTVAVISCNAELSHYRLCNNGEWNSAIPDCYPIGGEAPSKTSENSSPHFGHPIGYNNICPSLTSITSINFTCTHDGKRLQNCENAKNGTMALIQCNFFLNAYPSYLCKDGKWSSSSSKCFQSSHGPTTPAKPSKVPGNSNQFDSEASYNRKSDCPSLTSNISINFKCKRNGEPLLNCDNPADGTTALILCNSAYEAPSLQENPIRVCRNGKWNSAIPQCSPIPSKTPPVTFENSNQPSADDASYPLFCQSLISSTSTTFQCQHGGETMQNCNNPVDGTIVTISCNSFYEEPSVQNNSYRFCKNGSWGTSIPQCNPIFTNTPPNIFENSNQPSADDSSFPRVCPSLTSSISTNFKCKHGSKLLQNCDNLVDGTSVFISCNSFYEEPSLQYNSYSVCKNGNWNTSIAQCYPICGKAPSRIIGKSNPFFDIKNLSHDYPWHVGIYSTNGKEYICGGSIINPKIILTAAHCFLDDELNYKLLDYLVGAGKYYRNYGDQRDKYAQYSKVSNIRILKKYGGRNKYYTADIAILILSNPFELSIAVQPICIETNGQSNILDNSIGIVPGWGNIKARGQQSEVLKSLKIPYLPFDRCLQAVPELSRKYIASDKICGGFINTGVGICNGDGGGGLIFKDVADHRYYIKGIVSVNLFKKIDGDCNMNQSAGYTSVSNHISFVKSAILAYS